MEFLGKIIDLDSEPFVVAELSCNHGGDVETACLLVRQAKNAGADAVKIQIYTADEMCLQSDYIIQGGEWSGRDLYTLYKENETNEDLAREMFNQASKIGIPMFASVFSERSLEIASALGAKAFKIASFELPDIPLIKRVARLGYPMVLSTGMADLGEIQDAVKAADTVDMVLLHCVSGYPVPAEEANLWRINVLSNMFSLYTGFSDHLSANYLLSGAYAVVAGARMLEKHLYLGNDTADKAFSLTPSQFRAYTQAAKVANKLATRSDTLSEDPQSMLRRSLWVKAPITKGTKFSEATVGIYRPGSGDPPKNYHKALEMYASRDMPAGTPLKLEEHSVYGY